MQILVAPTPRQCMIGSTPPETQPREYSKLLIIRHQMHHVLLILWYRWVMITAGAVKSHLGSDV